MGTLLFRPRSDDNTKRRLVGRMNYGDQSEMQLKKPDLELGNPT